MNKVCEALAVTKTLSLKGAEEGRAAAYLITNAEGSALHRKRIQTQIEDFDKDTRDRFLAGSLIPAAWYLRAQAARRWWQEKMLDVFATTDLIIAPATPFTAPKIGTRTMMISGQTKLLRPNLGLYTQPFSAIGLPVVSVPVWTKGAEMPIGVQLVAPPWREDICLTVASHLEQMGVTECRQPALD